jgi:hypothetical protein
LYGLLAEFHDPASLVSAAHLAHERGYRKLETYTPFPIEELDEALELPPSRLPFIVLVAGIVGAITGYAMQYYVAVIHYPINIGGRPLNSWPAFIVIVFELTVLFASVAAFLGMLALNGLPAPYHPVFNVPSFALASRDRFFLCIEATDPMFDRNGTERFLSSLEPYELSEVEY